MRTEAPRTPQDSKRHAAGEQQPPAQSLGISLGENLCKETTAPNKKIETEEAGAHHSMCLRFFAVIIFGFYRYRIRNV